MVLHVIDPRIRGVSKTRFVDISEDLVTDIKIRLCLNNNNLSFLLAPKLM